MGEGPAPRPAGCPHALNQAALLLLLLPSILSGLHDRHQGGSGLLRPLLRRVRQDLLGNRKAGQQPGMSGIAATAARPFVYCSPNKTRTTAYMHA